MSGARGAGADRRALDRADELLDRELAAELAPALELVESVRSGLVGPQVEPGGLGRRRRVEPVGGAEHRRRPARAPLAIDVSARHAADRGRRAAPPRSFTISASTRSGERMPRPRSRPSRKSAWRAAEPGVRGADEAEQVAAAAAEPREAEQREERVPVRGLRRAAASRRARTGRRARRTPTRAARAPGRATGQTTRISLGSGAGRAQLEDLVGDELERRARAGALEEADRALAVGRRRRDVLEQRPLEVRQRRMRVLRVPRRQLLEPPAGEARQIGGRALERGEGRPARLVRERDRDVRPGRRTPRASATAPRSGPRTRMRRRAGRPRRPRSPASRSAA